MCHKTTLQIECSEDNLTDFREFTTLHCDLEEMYSFLKSVFKLYRIYPKFWDALSTYHTRPKI